MTQSPPIRLFALATLACTFSAALLADLSESTLLQTNAALNLDTGAVGSSGDILWNGTTIAPQSSATVRNLGNLGATNFDGLPESYWTNAAAGAKSTPIAANLLVAGDVFAAITKTGKVAKVLVGDNTGGIITLRFTTFGASASSAPAVVQILNNSSGTPPGLPNSGIAPSSLFIVTGTGLADPGTPTLQDTQAPGGLPLKLNGASITVIVNGVTTHPALYYTSPTQLAAVLPAATPVGTGNLTVTYNGATSAPAPIQVVASAVGFNQFNQIPIPLGKLNSNVVLGVATDASTGALLTFTNSGAPGQIITLWATGLGADPADSDTAFASPPHAVNTPMQIYFGGVLSNILYQGSAGYPGVNQINLVIPDSVLKGCYVPLVAVTGKIISNVVMFPIHPGGGTCVEPTNGTQLTGDQILQNTKDVIKAGGVQLIQTNITNAAGVLAVTNTADAAFFKDTGLLASATGRSGIITPGGCSVGPLVAGGPITLVGLDAGSVTFTGPSGPALNLPPLLLKGDYGATLAAGAIPSSGGTFTFNGAGGPDVGAFTSTVTFTNPLPVWTNRAAAATVDRTQGLTFTWTGGNPGTYVIIAGSVITAGVTVGYSCRVPVDPGQFTVPSYILLGMPTGSGSTLTQHQVLSTFSATGLDLAGVTALVEYSVTTTYK